MKDDPALMKKAMEYLEKVPQIPEILGRAIMEIEAK